MKLLIILFSLMIHSAVAKVITLDIALETASISVDYSEISKTGIIRVKGCSVCSQETYRFNEAIIIKKQGETIPIAQFLKEYWKAKHPTLFANKDDLSIMRISY